MDRFIVLCDHDFVWVTELKEELDDEKISIGYVDSIDDIESIFPDAVVDIIVCSAIEFYSFIEYEDTNYLYKYILNNGISVMVIADEYSESDEINALKFGCFDYQLRSASVKAVAQRIKNRLANTSGKKRLYFDNNTNSIYSDVDLPKLTKRENAVLKVLLSNEGSTVEKSIILQKVWGENFKGNIRVIDTIIKQLRQKLSGYNIKIITYYGIGVSLSFTG